MFTEILQNGVGQLVEVLPVDGHIVVSLFVKGKKKKELVLVIKKPVLALLHAICIDRPTNDPLPASVLSTCRTRRLQAASRGWPSWLGWSVGR